MRKAAESLVALALLVLGVVCWNLGVTEHVFVAADTRPQFVAVRYSGSWIAASVVCVGSALLLLVDIGRMLHAQRSHTR